MRGALIMDGFLCGINVTEARRETEAKFPEIHTFSIYKNECEKYGEQFVVQYFIGSEVSRFIIDFGASLKPSWVLIKHSVWRHIRNQISGGTNG